MLLVLNAQMFRSITAPTSPTTFAQLKSCAREEEEHGEPGGNDCHYEDNEDRSGIHYRSNTRRPIGQTQHSGERPPSGAGCPIGCDSTPSRSKA